MHGLHTKLIYSTLFYKSPKNCGYYVYAQTVCSRPLLGEEGPGNEARNYLHVASDQVETKCE